MSQRQKQELVPNFRVVGGEKGMDTSALNHLEREVAQGFNMMLPFLQMYLSLGLEMSKLLAPEVARQIGKQNMREGNIINLRAEAEKRK